MKIHKHKIASIGPLSPTTDTFIAASDREAGPYREAEQTTAQA